MERASLSLRDSVINVHGASILCTNSCLAVRNDKCFNEVDRYNTNSKKHDFKSAEGKGEVPY